VPDLREISCTASEGEVNETDGLPAESPAFFLAVQGIADGSFPQKEGSPFRLI
jgi:hypothetical protein